MNVCFCGACHGMHSPDRSAGPTEATLSVIEEWVASCDVGLRKPDPKFYFHALERAGVKASEAVYVDDRPELVDAVIHERAQRLCQLRGADCGYPVVPIVAIAGLSDAAQFHDNVGAIGHFLHASTPLGKDFVVPVGVGSYPKQADCPNGPRD